MNSLSKVAGLEWSADGYSTLSGVLKDAADALDAIFLGWATELGARDHAFPTFIAARDLAPIGYLESFPHLATFAVTIDRADAELEAVAARHGKAGELALEAGKWEPARQLLTPAACYHFYHRLAGTELAEDKFLTTNCLCHRRENSYQPLQRQWCFQMREIVCIGAPDTVQSCIENCRRRIDALTEKLRLVVSWEEATDPFFNPGEDPKALTQLLEPIKRELIFGDGLAIASINRHRTFFGDCYNIRMHGDCVSSACVAFGVERWLFALIRRHGPDPAAWPAW